MKQKKQETKAILLGAGKPYKGINHSALKSSGEKPDYLILDWILSSIKRISQEIIFIGGYQISKIKKKYPSLSFTKNKKWKKVNPHFLYLARN